MIFGYHTIPDLKWLVQSRDYFFGRVTNAIGKAYTDWKTKDPQTFAAWWSDWQAFQMRYALARESALAAIDGAKWAIATPDDVIDAEPQWIAIIRAFQQVQDTRTKGDFGDLVQRLSAAGYAVTFPDIPPDSSVDWDLKVLKTADDVLKAVEKAKQAAEDVLDSSFPWVACAAVLVGGVVLLKVLK